MGVEIELSTFCNIHCKICPRDNIKRPKGLMSIETFEVLQAWLPPNTGVTFSGMGEPLLNKNIIYFIEEFSKKNIKVLLKSNGILLVPEMVNKLLTAQVMHIQISVLGNDKESIERNMKGAKYDEIMNNLKYLAKLPKHLVSVFNISEENSESTITEQISNNPLLDRFNQFKTKVHSRAGFLNKEKTYDVTKDKSFCGIFNEITYVNWKGDILSCCNDLSGESKLGNISDLSIEQVNKIKEERILEGKWYSFCKYCDDEFRFKTKTYKSAANSFIK